MITLMAGNAYKMRIIPTVHRATDSFRDLTIDKRGCRFLDEVPENITTIFKYYTQKSCIFNCLLKQAVSQVKHQE